MARRDRLAPALGCVWLIARAIPAGGAPPVKRRVDLIGTLLCVPSLGTLVVALIDQPRLGWSSRAVKGSLVAGVILFVAFVFYDFARE